jgi:5-(hydroxymethyl)furfural/furfural oxidase
VPGFDVVIVGAGSAGAAMAARVSEDNACRVLLVEAGADYCSADTPPAISGPNFTRALGLRGFHWRDLKAVLTDRQSPRSYPCGRGVGGSSAINGQLAVRALPSDFSGWFGWSWEEALAAFIGLEDDLDYGSAPYHGRGGPLPISRVASKDWGAVSEALWNSGLTRHPDLNAPDSTGLSPIAWNRREGRRASVKDAYLEPARNRANLTISANTLAARVVFYGSRVAGVEVVTAGGVRLVEADCVIVCAGALYTPALLLRSGLGPADEVRALGIDVIADLLGVGQNLYDHPSAWFSFPLRQEARTRSVDVLPGYSILRFSSGLAPNDVQILPLDRTFTTTSGGLMVSVMRPFSRGTVRLRDRHPTTDPIVEFRLLTDSRDLARLRDGFRYCLSLMETAPFTSITEGICQPGDEHLDEWLLTHCDGNSHAGGTCRMGPPGDPQTVVDATGRVLGVDGLRVVDASIVPEPVSAPPQLSVIMIAERLSQAL